MKNQAEFDRFDIMAAYWQLEIDYNIGGWLHERPSNQRRMESTSMQLSRIGYKFERHPDKLSKNAKKIYKVLEKRYGFDKFNVP